MRTIRDIRNSIREQIRRVAAPRPRPCRKRIQFCVGLAAGILLLGILALVALRHGREQVVSTDVLVVGGGVSGLSTAWEAAHGGRSVIVAERSSVFGGNGVVSTGGLWIVGTPLQRSHGIQDSSALAEDDMLKWGEDADPAWVHIYVRDSRREIYDWLTDLGVRFTALNQAGGNHLPRFHRNPQEGLGVVLPIYRDCLRSERIQFSWNTRIDKLLSRNDIVIGAVGTNLRTGAKVRFEARAVVLATGGFQGNEQLVRTNWPGALPKPDRLLLGASTNSDGSGIAMGTAVGGATHRLDHQWHYACGVPDPRFPHETRGVKVTNINAVWINAQGKRFVNEWLAAQLALAALMQQKPASYWMIFDAKSVNSLDCSGTDWADPKAVRTLLVDNSAVTKQGQTWAELAQKTGLPAEQLEASIVRYNRLVQDRDDTEFLRFGRHAQDSLLMDFALVRPSVPPPLDTPPYYAMQLFPMTRKNMGGLKIDVNCRVLGADDKPIAGLFAVGEASGLGGVNGKAGLEGTFLGPSLLQGRRAGRFIATGVADPSSTALPEARAPLSASVITASENPRSSFVCKICHRLPMMFFASQSGYWHFGRVHNKATERDYDCRKCHREIELLRPWRHHIDDLIQTSTCSLCHLPEP